MDGKTYFNYILDSIWKDYKGNLEKKLGITGLEQEDVTEITLKPFKISRDNSTITKQNYHIDCTIDIVCKKTFTAKFWIKSPEASKYDLYDAKDYIRGRKVETTEKATIGSKEVINGITYVDGVLIANKTYSLPSDFIPQEPEVPVTSQLSTTSLDRTLMSAWRTMQADASSQGLNIYIASAYRVLMNMYLRQLFHLLHTQAISMNHGI